MIATENSSVVSYIIKKGVHTLQYFVWKYGIPHCVDIKGYLLCISNRFNILADRLSRMSKPIQPEWSLNQKIVNSVFLMTEHPNIDLFAIRLNNRLSVYVPPIPDDKALSRDALSKNWDRIQRYAFPPFHIIPAVLNKIRQFKCRIVLVAPLWSQR